MSMFNLPADSRNALIEPFDDIYSKHVDMLYRVCFSYMKNMAETEDIVADVFVKLLERGANLESNEHAKHGFCVHPSICVKTA